ncbi:MAG: bifunctional oligoribonuclease/PAP phosphatase NrnA [Chloroflexota bacterium]|nr:bifunctional oligoribonuclease/PAP phosphatase NrnA [Chloroflexota bacterium]
MSAKTARHTEPQWQQAADAIAAATSILLVSHIAPDGDAVGSLLGLADPLRDQGKIVTAAIDDGVPPELKFIPRSDIVASTVAAGEFDLMISLDSSDLERIGQAGAYGMAHCRQVINLDHHPTNTRYGDIHLIVPEAVAAVEIVYDFLAHLGWRISPTAAHALLTGLVTDTQGFRISATNSRTLEIAQDLMSKGAPLSQIMAQTLNRRSFKEVELWKLALPSVRLKDGLIYAAIRQCDLRQVGLRKPGDGGLVSYLVTVDQAKISIVFKELPERKVEVGFRAKPGYDVASLAFQLGGGGHTLASGCTIDGDLQQVEAKVLPLAHQAIAEGAGSLE